MHVHRRAFNQALATALLGLGANRAMGGRVSGRHSPSPAEAANAKGYFFQNPTFEYTLLVCLGRAYHSAGNPGKVLYLTRQIEDGNFDSAYRELKKAGDEALALAEDAAAHGHRESARQAYLWAQNYYDGATYFIDGSTDPSRMQPTWELLNDCWVKAAALFNPAIEAVRIPYEGTELHGYFVKGSRDARQRPLLIMNNGSDGCMLDMWTTGGAGALARGYNCLFFDGPGQGYALWKQNLSFRPDWEKVITPVVDYALKRRDVDPKRIALLGISQGGYWVSRAVAFEKRIAAAVADPGVVDVSTSWTSSLPAPMLGLLRSGRKAEFDSYMAKSLDLATAAYLRFRMRPFGLNSYFEVYQAVQAYKLAGVAERIECPLLIMQPANEAFWPGQSQQLNEMVHCVKQLVPFSASDGADLHCEPKGYGLRDLRVFDWLDETLKV